MPDLLGRDFTAAAAEPEYVGDITYLPLADGTNLYLATVIDCYSRRLAGWAVADHMRTELVVDALRGRPRPAAAPRRGDLPQPITDPSTPRRPSPTLRPLGVIQSMGAVGTSADNALAESFNATLKRETLQGAHCLARRGEPAAARCSGG